MMTSRLDHWKVILLLLWGVTASAQSQVSTDQFSQKLTQLGFHVGSLTEFYQAVQVDNQGGRESFAFNPLVGFSAEVQLNPSWELIPELNWVLPRETGTGITQNLFMIRTDVAWRGGEWWRLRVGSSLMVNLIRGEGGTRQMKNGSGTSRFYVPAESRTSINNTLDFGAEALWGSFGARFQTYLYSILKAERRQVSHALTLSYYYDLGK